MRCGSRRASPEARRACLALAALLGAAAALPVARTAGAATESTAAVEFRRELKRLEYEEIHAGARAERAELARERTRRPRHARNSGPAAGAVSRGAGTRGERQDRPPDILEAGGPQGAARSRARAHALARMDAPVNHRMNDPRTDQLPGSTQAEVSLAVLGSRMVAGWNDAEDAGDGPIGWGWSADGGNTWTDAGSLPVNSAVQHWVSDPVVTIDAHTGTFHLVAMAITPHAQSAIGVLSGRFDSTGTGFTWTAPVVARAVRDTLPDKPWAVADSATGRMYMTYTTFFSIGRTQVDQIEFQRSLDGGRSWEPPRVLSSRTDLGLVQGSRPAVGPDGEVCVAWNAVDTTEASGGHDWIRFRDSHDGGRSFASEENAASLFSNFTSGGPGFNRGYGLVFPGIAVDRSTGPYRGRAYVTWNESLDFLHSAPGDSNPRFEREPNALPPSATPFNPGETLRGAIDAGDDVDMFRFFGTRGETVLLYLDSLATNLNATLRILCSDGETRLAFSSPVWAGRPRVTVLTLPRSDIYYVRLASVGSTQGGYRLRTGRVTNGAGRARDQRDVFVAARDPHQGWGTPVRVNDDPGWFDDWLPEVAVAADGRVYAAWYDWRDRTDVTCGGWSNVYLARSETGGASWLPGVPVSDEQTSWSDVASLVAPNQGDYISLFADAANVTVAWADGRDGDPDVVMAQHALADDPRTLPVAMARLDALRPNPCRGQLTVEFSVAGPVPAALELVDLAGRRRWRAPLGSLEAGRHTTSLDFGHRLEPGIYWVRLVAGAGAAVRKVVVLP